MPVLEDDGFDDPYKFNALKPFFAKFKSGGLDAQHDLKDTKGTVAHKTKFKGAGFQGGDRWESITTNKDTELKYWMAPAGFAEHDGAFKVQAKID